MHVIFHQGTQNENIVPKSRLYVKGLPDFLPEEKKKEILFTYFQTFGKVMDIIILSKGSAMIHYATLEEAKRAVTYSNSTGKDNIKVQAPLPLKVSYAESQDERTKRV